MIHRDYQPYLNSIQHWWNVYECYKYQSPLESINTTMSDMGFHEGSLHVNYHGDSLEMAKAFGDMKTYKKECEEVRTFVEHFTREKKVSQVADPKVVFAILIGLSAQMKTEDVYVLPVAWLYHATRHGYVEEESFIYLASLGVKPLLGLMMKDGVISEHALPSFMAYIERQEWDEAMSMLYDTLYGYDLHPMTTPSLS